MTVQDLIDAMSPAERKEAADLLLLSNELSTVDGWTIVKEWIEANDYGAEAVDTWGES